MQSCLLQKKKVFRDPGMYESCFLVCFFFIFFFFNNANYENLQNKKAYSEGRWQWLCILLFFSLASLLHVAISSFIQDFVRC